MFGIELSNQAKKFLRNCENELRVRIMTKLKSLKENPVPSDAKFIGRDKEGKIFRVRVGGIRIIYRDKDSEKVIIISKIDKRERVYD